METGRFSSRSNLICSIADSNGCTSEEESLGNLRVMGFFVWIISCYSCCCSYDHVEKLFVNHCVMESSR